MLTALTPTANATAVAAPVVLSTDWLVPEGDPGAPRTVEVTVTANAEWPDATLVISRGRDRAFVRDFGAMMSGEVRTVVWNGRHMAPKYKEMPYARDGSYAVRVMVEGEYVTARKSLQVLRTTGMSWTSSTARSRHLRARGLRVIHSLDQVEVALFFRARTPRKKGMGGAIAIIQFDGQRKAYFASLVRTRKGKWRKPSLVLGVPFSDEPSRDIRCRGIDVVFKRSVVKVSVPRQCLKKGRSRFVHADMHVMDRHRHSVFAMKYGSYSKSAELPPYAS